MHLNKIMAALLFATTGFSLAASAATLTANDQTNTITGLDSSQMLSKDSGVTWLAYQNENQNNFPGNVTVTVAVKDDKAIESQIYDPSQSYPTTGTVVRYNNYYWTSKWWVNPGEYPGVNSVWERGTEINIQTLGIFDFTPYTGQAAIDFQNQQKAKVAGQRKIYGYFPEWGVYDAHRNFTPDKIDYSMITHLNYGFGIVKNGEVITHDTEQGPGLMRDLDKRTEAAGVTNIISIGGWNNSLEGEFETATATDAGVEKLANSIVNYMLTWGFDGVDVDWEYPDTEADKGQFTKLIKSLRSKLDDQGIKDDKYYQLSAAVTASHSKMQYINLAENTALLDSVNVMAYDFHGAFDPITGHNAPLHANSKDEDQKFNAASAMAEYATTWKVPKNKLMMGIPWYGRGWGNVEPTEIVKGLPGLFAPGTATVHGAWDDDGQFTGTNPWYRLKEMLASGDYTRYWDPEAMVPYLYNSKTKEFFTYDDPQSVREKVNYIKQQQFGGAIVWDLSGDTDKHELGNIVADVIKGDVTPNITNFQLGRIFADDARAGFKWIMSREYYENKTLRFTMPTPTDHSNYTAIIKPDRVSNYCKNENKPDSETVVICLAPGMVTEPGVVAKLVDDDNPSNVYASLEVTQEQLNTAESSDIVDTYIKNINGKLEYSVISDISLIQSRQYLNMYIDHKDQSGRVTDSTFIGSFYKMDPVNSGTYASMLADLPNNRYLSFTGENPKAGDEYVFALADGSRPDSARLKVLTSMTVTPQMLQN
ncbi:glycosyl hydrolase family 18 protein [Enterobacter sp.]|uniref:glycosyl hydrolase family 18 protein n=1 Tax=Enterobacter sp. TaxID=42895 RepID=UPI00296E61A2|nr:glycosyl hydrolase family 18 protein [Enterobacter sp.]